MDHGGKSQYELERDARVAANKERMAALGIGRAAAALAATKQQQKKKMPSKPRKPRATSEPTRRSRRQQNMPTEVDVSDMKKVDALLAGADEPRKRYRDSDSDESDYEQRPRRRRVAVFAALPEAVAKVLRKVDVCAAAEAFLNDKRAHGEWFNTKASATNTSRVMRQVRPLAGGEGIKHPRSEKEGCVFAKGKPVTLGDDLEALFGEAYEFENTHGEDRGNGWLLRHPIKKLLSVQQHLAAGGKIQGFEAPALRAVPPVPASDEEKDE